MCGRRPDVVESARSSYRSGASLRTVVGLAVRYGFRGTPSAPGIDNRWADAIPVRRDIPVRYDDVASTRTSGRLSFPGRNPYRPAGDAPTLWHPKGRRIGSGASLFLSTFLIPSYLAESPDLS